MPVLAPAVRSGRRAARAAAAAVPAAVSAAVPAGVQAAVSAVALAVALGGCGPAAGQPGPPGRASPGSAASPGSPGAGCTRDYCAPADWDTARATAPLALIRPFAEPLNVVISARSDVPLSAIQRAMDDWATVTAATEVSLAGIRLRCISAEKADVAGRGYLPEQLAWRLGGCLGGNELSLSGNEAHVRFWHQPVPGSRYGAWFAAASYETMCLVRDGRLQTVSANKAWAALHPASAYHCVDGGPGTFRAAHPDGYDDGAGDFAAAVAAAARKKGWRVSQRVITVPRGEHAGEGGVPFSDAVYVLTVSPGRPG